VETVEIGIARLRHAMRNALHDRGHDPGHCVDITDHLIEASVSGHPSHGVEVFPLVLSNTTPVTISPSLRQDGNLAILDGAGVTGYSAGRMAVDSLIRGGSSGNRVCAITNVQPSLGCLGVHGRRVALSGRVFAAGTVSPPAMSLLDGATFGTNPICVAVPLDRAPLVIDMACSVVSWGTASASLARTGGLSPAWGRIHEDEIVLAPSGGFKGILLAACVELICAALIEAPSRDDVEWCGVFSSLPASPSVRSIAAEVAVELKRAGGNFRYPGEYSDSAPTLAISVALASLLGLRQ